MDDEYNQTGWELTNHGHLPRPTEAQVDEMRDDEGATAVYAAQMTAFYPGIPHTVAGGKIVKRRKPAFASTTEIEKFVLGIQRSAFAKKQWSKFAAGQPVRFYMGHEGEPWEAYFGVPDWKSDDPAYLMFGANASTNNETLTVALAQDGLGLAKGTILHELAHVINNYEGVMRDHGPDWRGIFLKLVHKYIPKKHAALVKALKAAGLTWTA